MKHIILYTILFTCSLTAQAQTDTPFNKKLFADQKDAFKEANYYFEEGNGLFEEGELAYKAALTNYLKAQDFNPNSSELNFKIGICYLKTIGKDNALPYLEKAFQLNERVDPGIFFYLAEAHHFRGNWAEAINWYQKFKAQLIAIEEKKNQEAVDFQLQLVNKKIEECENGKSMAATPIRVFIDNIGEAINSPYPEYGVTISADESVMLFTSRRPDAIGYKESKSAFDDATEDIYMSVKDKNGEWSKAKNLGRPINDKGHDATVSLGPDGQYMIMYKDEDGGALFESHLDGDYWTKPQLLDKQINSNYHETEAVYSLDRKRIYFISNKPDGNLGMRDPETGEYTHDIFYCDWDDKKEKWGSPQNIGALINTKYDEIGLYLHPDGKTLFFSSKGHNTMGGYDIFKTVHDEDYDTWSTPENIGYPVNTPDDDVFLIVSANGRHGYYASARTDGFGEKDIYVITFLGAEKQLLLTSEDPLLANLLNPIGEKLIEPKVEVISQASILKGRVLDAITKEPIMAEIELVDNSKNKQVAVFQSNKASGKYLVSLPDGRNYGIAVKHPEYLFHSENFDIPKGNGFQEYEKIVYLKKATVGSKIVLNNIFFDFDKATLRKESTAELERLAQMLKDMPSLKIELGGHTDSKGSDAYNQSLSERRAKSVVDYLVNTAGISKSRLTYIGYGEKEPVASNNTEEGMQLNRRTEFKIIAN